MDCLTRKIFEESGSGNVTREKECRTLRIIAMKTDKLKIRKRELIEKEIQP